MLSGTALGFLTPQAKKCLAAPLPEPWALTPPHTPVSSPTRMPCRPSPGLPPPGPHLSPGSLQLGLLPPRLARTQDSRAGGPPRQGAEELGQGSPRGSGAPESGMRAPLSSTPPSMGPAAAAAAAASGRPAAVPGQLRLLHQAPAVVLGDSRPAAPAGSSLYPTGWLPAPVSPPRSLTGPATRCRRCSPTARTTAAPERPRT